MEDTFDYIVVGAGSAGCVLANRLTEDPDVSVLLLEAGGWDNSPYIKIPLAWGRIFSRRYFDWGYDTEPEPELNGRSIECTRGKVIGGSSSTNGMAYGRGHPKDYDDWAEAGLPGWSFADVLPYFRKSETWEDGPNHLRGGEGPLITRRNGLTDPLVEGWMEAGKGLQFPFNEDYNGERQEGFAIPQWTIKNGLRCSTSVAYLKPAMKRPNLKVVTRALAERVLFEGTRAIGVRYDRRGSVTEARARREVILAGGAINSPHLLALSGIGDPAELKAIGIDPVADVPGVGKNLHDHMTIGLEYDRKETGPFLKSLRFDRFVRMVGEALIKGTGMATSLPMGTKAFVRSEVSGESCDLTILFRAAPLAPQQYLAKPQKDGFGYRVLLMKPESRGRVQTVSPDPKTAPKIFQNFLTSERDWKALRSGFRLVRRLTEHPAVAPFVERETLPGTEVQTDVEIDAHIRAHASTAHHPVGTCKMAPADDPDGVVDGELRVRGTQALRVVDASIMPEIVSGPPNAVVVMIAEKAADMIRTAQAKEQ
ncbi:choline dehydrogenase [Maritimibacter sp. DP07]|uniref:Choline dehydrogenase n=1 Tax=Maritimibacter harenae TaxID=2606218 RepID=A0A845LZZ6_9RHOB|nr:choline dehydrogenase [Maritimibacter harenae]MZR11668.1 choline dehydrogenase [Maritimibacter harenae]